MSAINDPATDGCCRLQHGSGFRMQGYGWSGNGREVNHLCILLGNGAQGMMNASGLSADQCKRIIYGELGDLDTYSHETKAQVRINLGPGGVPFDAANLDRLANALKAIFAAVSQPPRRPKGGSPGPSGKGAGGAKSGPSAESAAESPQAGPEPVGNNGFIDRLLSRIDAFVREPALARAHLKTRVDGCTTRCQGGCIGAIPAHGRVWPWDQPTLDDFFAWTRGWYPRNRYEEAFAPVFALSAIDQLVLEELGERGRTSFHMEFKGNSKVGPAPACIPRGAKSVSFTWGNGRKSPDFMLLPPLPRVIGEYKVVMPGTTNPLDDHFADLSKSAQWVGRPLQSSAHGPLQFDAALAILIDLSGDSACADAWKREVDCAAWTAQGVRPHLVSPWR